ncbi:NlpC/P60 family protein [Planotetraspora sp. A-T 1434]|uniref:C40 family peptidase n=1 Tax=Planotetraspora sp. A-T 1434 TaxID=2979219 RepID=UPI0021C20DDB|nr:NlpC/P60 family protein [Planotetraspora sp. A-T 1434]MCT9931322.1 NlpC/P60 family protein [Planotetraspora sp. A-T 1434]
MRPPKAPTEWWVRPGGPPPDRRSEAEQEKRSGKTSSRHKTTKIATERTTRTTRGEIAVHAAERWLGLPYTWGGGSLSGPSRGIGKGAVRVGFDCSGLAVAAWARAGVKLAHYTGTQFHQGRRVSLHGIRPGDLLFFGGGSGAPAHVGLYAKGGMMIHAPKTGDVVRKVDVLHSAFYLQTFRGAVRPG